MSGPQDPVETVLGHLFPGSPPSQPATAGKPATTAEDAVCPECSARTPRLTDHQLWHARQTVLLQSMVAAAVKAAGELIQDERRRHWLQAHR